MSNFFPFSISHWVSDARLKQKNRSRQATISRFPELAIRQPAENKSVRYPSPEGASLKEKVSTAMLKARDYILSQQTREGFWWEVLDTNTTLTSEYLMAAHFMNLVDPAVQKEACAYLLEQQEEDGGWTLYANGPSELSTTIEAYFALKLAGHSAEAAYMIKARELIIKLGGIENARVFTKINLA